MTDERLDDLLQSWSQERDSGRQPTATDLCRDCPDLADALAQRIAIVQRFEQLVDPEAASDTATPSCGDTSQSSDASATAKTSVPNPLPPAFGAFEPRSILGEGGMGTVYLAMDAKLGRPVALKVMKKELAAKAESRERFLREARTMATVEHDHIMTIYAVGEQDDVPFLVMPVLKGESLEARLQRLGRLPLADACRIGREIAAGLHAAHERGLIHRDIKPSNIWLEVRGQEPEVKAESFLVTDLQPRTSGARVKILDFGLARAAEGQQNLTQSGAVLGTPAYMAPEQAEGVGVDRRSDLFSLGCVLYQMTTGQRPFTGPTVMAVLNSLANHHPQPPHALNAAVPPALSDLILRLLAKDPSQRPASAQAVVEALSLIEAELAAPRSAITPPIPPVARGGEGEVASSPTAIEQTVTPTAAPARALWRRAPRALAAVAVPLLAGAAFLAWQIINIDTPTGRLVIQSDDENVEVVVRKNGALLIDRTGKREIELKVGTYEIELAEQKEGLRLSTKKFTITRNGRETVKVEFIPKVANAMQPNGKLVFRDDFASPVPQAVPLFGKESMSFKQVDGQGVLIGTTPGILPIIYRKEKLRDFAAEFQFKAPAPAAEREYGLIFRSAYHEVAGLPSYYALFLNPKKGTARLVFWDAGKWIDMKDLPLKDGLLIPSDVNQVRLEVVGNEFRLFLNKTFVGRHEDQSLTEPGIIGLFAFSPDAGENPVFFKNLRVYELGAQREGQRETELDRSPLDNLDPAQIRPEERFAWQPKELVAVLGEHKLRHWGMVQTVALDPKGDLIASSGADRTVRLWDASTLQERAAIRWAEPGEASHLAFSADGKTLAIQLRLKSTTLLYDVAQQPPKVRASIQGVFAVYNSTRYLVPGNVNPFTPDGKTLFVQAPDAPIVEAWDCTTPTPRKRGAHRLNNVASGSLCALADGRLLHVAPLQKPGENYATLWDLSGATPKELARLPLDGAEFAVSPDGQWFANSTETTKSIKIYHIAAGTFEEKGSFTDPEIAPRAAFVEFTADSRSLVYYVSSPTDYKTPVPVYKVRDLGSGESRLLVPRPSQAPFVFAADGQRMVGRGAPGFPAVVVFGKTGAGAWTSQAEVAPQWSASADGIRLVAYFNLQIARWDLDRPAPVAMPIKQALSGSAAAVLPDGRVLTRVAQDAVGIVDPRKGDAAEPVPAPGVDPFFIAATSTRDGKTVAVRTYNSIALVDLAGNRPTIRANLVPEHKAGLRHAQIFPDGSHLVSMTAQGEAFLWNLRAPKPALVKKWEGVRCGPTFASEGATLVLGFADGKVRLFDYSGVELKETSTLQPSKVAIHGAALLAGGKTLVCADAAGKIRFLELPFGAVAKEWQWPGPTEFHAAADGRHLLALNANRTVYVLRLGQAPSVAADPNRAVADWLIRSGGYFTTTRDGQILKVAALEQVPAEPFTFAEVVITPKPGGPELSESSILQNLARITSLSYGLNFGKVPLTDEGLRQLLGFPGLRKMERLILQRTEVTDAGLGHLQGLPRLSQLALVSCSNLTDRSLEHVGKLSAMRELGIINTPVTNAGLARLSALKLTKLTLQVVPGVTDEAIPVLSGFKDLQSLILKNTSVTPAGLKKLRAALPTCKITTD